MTLPKGVVRGSRWRGGYRVGGQTRLPPALPGLWEEFENTNRVQFYTPTSTSSQFVNWWVGSIPLPPSNLPNPPKTNTPVVCSEFLVSFIQGLLTLAVGIGLVALVPKTTHPLLVWIPMTHILTSGPAPPPLTDGQD